MAIIVLSYIVWLLVMVFLPAIMIYYLNKIVRELDILIFSTIEYTEDEDIWEEAQKYKHIEGEPYETFER